MASNEAALVENAVLKFVILALSKHRN